MACHKQAYLLSNNPPSTSRSMDTSHCHTPLGYGDTQQKTSFLPLLLMILASNTHIKGKLTIYCQPSKPNTSSQLIGMPPPTVDWTLHGTTLTKLSKSPYLGTYRNCSCTSNIYPLTSLSMHHTYGLHLCMALPCNY